MSATLPHQLPAARRSHRPDEPRFHTVIRLQYSVGSSATIHGDIGKPAPRERAETNLSSIVLAQQCAATSATGGAVEDRARDVRSHNAWFLSTLNPGVLCGAPASTARPASRA